MGMREAFGGAMRSVLSSYTNLAAGILILWCARPSARAAFHAASHTMVCTPQHTSSLPHSLAAPPGPASALRNTALSTTWCALEGRYGGLVVLENGPLSIGKLITFQLYWNM